MDILSVAGLGFLAGAVTVVGGLLGMLFRIDKRWLNFLLTATTGLALAVILLGMLPAALEMGGVGYTALGFILGGVVFMVTGSLFPHTYGSERYGDRLYSILKTRSLVIAGLILYNIAAGLLIGAGFANSLKFGVIMVLAVILQNIPRGVAIREPLSDSMTGSHRGLFIMLLAGVPVLIGAAATFAALTSMVPAFLSTSTAFCSGALLFIVADQMIPIVKGYSRMHEIAVALFLGIFIGVLMLGIG